VCLRVFSNGNYFAKHDSTFSFIDLFYYGHVRGSVININKPALLLFTLRLKINSMFLSQPWKNARRKLRFTKTCSSVNLNLLRRRSRLSAPNCIKEQRRSKNWGSGENAKSFLLNRGQGRVIRLMTRNESTSAHQLERVQTEMASCHIYSVHVGFKVGVCHDSRLPVV